MVSAQEPQAGLSPSPVAPGVAVVDPAMQREIEAAFAAKPDVVAFYAARGYAALWADEAGQFSPLAEAALTVLSEAPRHALPASRYAGAISAAAGSGWSPAREVAFTRSYLAYGRDISSGALTPNRVDRNIKVTPRRPEPASLLLGLATAADPLEFLRGLAPQAPEYANLIERFAALRTLAAEPAPWGSEVAQGRSLREGDREERVLQLRSRLTALGDLVPERASMGVEASTTTLVAANDVTRDVPSSRPQGRAGERDLMLFDAELAEAVRRFQRRHGLNDDGIVGPATRAQLNASPAFRAEQVAVNLERMRWLNWDLGERYVIVNIAGFTMRVVENGRVAFDSRVVVGTRRYQTPEFSDDMEHMVINPTWFVPRSIATSEILPELQEDPSYLMRKNMFLVGANEWEIDWSTVTPATFPGRVRQAPGEGNALGRVKFMFPNDDAIYLHDTPQRNLFARDIRAYSHGCVRVEKPLEFAYFLLSSQLPDPARSFERWLETGREMYVHLDEHLPVHLTYRTAWVDDEGGPQFRGDVYGRDALVTEALRAAGVTL